MPRKKRPLPTYRDGWAHVYREKDRKTDFSAQRNAASTEHMDFVAKLAFAEQSCREQDFEFAHQRGFNLSVKVKTMAHPEVDAGCSAFIGDMLFSISHVDRKGREMWLYMEEVRRLDTQRHPGEIVGDRP